jgi:hypothetical protein
MEGTGKKRHINNMLVAVAGLLLLVLVCAGCATYKATLKDQAFEGALPAGMYTLIKCGGGNLEDYATFVILVPEKSGYVFDVYKPDFEYRTLRGVPAAAAMQMARDFVKTHPEFLRSSSRAIIMPDGNIAGYEVRTLYRRTFLGLEDLFDVNYLLQYNNIIEVRIRLDEVALRHIRGGSDGRDGGK